MIKKNRMTLILSALQNCSTVKTHNWPSVLSIQAYSSDKLEITWVFHTKYGNSEEIESYDDYSGRADHAGIIENKREVLYIY